MSQPTRVRNGFRFGPFILDADTGELYKNGKLFKRLRPQAHKVLLELVKRAGEIVQREELRELVWGKGGQVPGYGLENIMWGLREDLEDSANHPLYIEALPGVGVRFIAPVEQLETPRLGLPETQSVAPDQAHKLVEEVLAYLDALAKHTAELPPYYPAHLTSPPSSGSGGFDDIRQLVQLVEDRKGFERWQAEERERIRAERMELDRLAYYYKPWRANPEQETEPQGTGRRFEERELPKTIAWDEQAGERWHRAVILGDPGFGKTWLLRYEARRLAVQGWEALQQRTLSLEQLLLPIFLRLSVLACCTGGIEEGLVAAMGAAHSERFRSWVRQKLETQQCTILLDACDEVPAEAAEEGQIVEQLGHRQHLARRLESFARQFPRPRLLMTSRLVGYAGSPIPGAKELELLAFEREQQEGFVEVWFGEEKAKGETFLEVLRQNPQVRGLGRIPLMLALMCRAHQEGQLSVPTRRVEVYQLCLRGLLRDWLGEKQRREVSDAYVDAQLELLEAVAYDLFREGYEQFGEGLLRMKMKPHLEKLNHTNELFGRTAESLIAEMKNDGILTTIAEHGEAKLIFLHRTFQEYLAAGGLAAQLKGDSEQAWVVVDRKAWDPEWEPVIVYLAARLGDIAVGKNTSDEQDRNRGLSQLKHLLGLLSDTRKDDFFRHRLALAAQCLPEIPAQVRVKLSREIEKITTAVFLVWWQHATRQTDQTVQHMTRALPQLAIVNGHVEGQPLREWLISRLHRRGKRTRDAAIQAVGHLGSAGATSEILASLAQLLKNDGGQNLTLEAISRIGSAAAVPGIVHWVEFETGLGRSAAAETLAKLGSDVATPEFLLRVAEQLEERSIDTCRVLGALGSAAAKPVVLDALGKVLDEPEQTAKAAFREEYSSRWFYVFSSQIKEGYYDFYKAAIQVVGSMGKAAATPEIVAALMEILEDKRRSGEAVAGWVLTQDTKKFRRELASELSRHLSIYHRDLIGSAAETLAKLGKFAATPELLNRLQELVCHEKPHVRQEAAHVLGALEGAESGERTVACLVEMLGDSDTQQKAVMALGKMGLAVAKPDVIAKLLRIAALREVYGVSTVLAEIGKAGGATLIVPRVEELLYATHWRYGHVDWDMSPGDTAEVAADALGKMGSLAARPTIVTRLVELLRDDNLQFAWPSADLRMQRRDVQEAAADALVKMGQLATTPEVGDWVQEVLTSKDRDIAWAMAWKELLSQLTGVSGLALDLASYGWNVTWRSIRPGWARPYIPHQLRNLLGAPRRALQEVVDVAIELRMEDRHRKARAIEIVTQAGHAVPVAQILPGLTRLINRGHGEDWVASVVLLDRMGFRVFKKRWRPYTVRTLSELSR